MSIIESYAQGTPVIGANIGGIPEIINENKTGYLFDPRSVSSLSEAINKAVNLGAEEYKNFRKNAFEFAQNNFNPDIYKIKIIDIYKKIIQNYETKSN